MVKLIKNSGDIKKVEGIEMTELVFGNITGVKIGQIFENRLALHDAGVHKSLQNCIHGRSKEGSCSIVFSGGFNVSVSL